MDPFTAGLLLQGGGTLLSSFLGAGRSRAEERRMREFRAKLMKIASPQYLMGLQNSLYNNALGSSAFGAARRGVFNAATNTSNRLAGSFAARGLSNSGIGAVGNALAGSAMAGQLGQLRTSLYNHAGSQAADAQQRELNALSAMGPTPSYNYGAQAFAGGVADIAKYLTDYYSPKKEASK